MRIRSRPEFLYAVFILFLVMNIALWLQTRTWRPIWGNVPPTPSHGNAEGMVLGDKQFAYRLTSIMLQNIGNATDRTRALSEYDYEGLKGWFLLADYLDPESNFVPSLAAYYFGATQAKQDLSPVIDYLEYIGQQPQPQKWRWLAQAVYMARFEQGDLQRALDLANKLANLPRDDLPLWAKQMPVLIVNAQGDKQMAYAMMVETLRSEIDRLSPQEILFMRNYLCGRILTPEQAAQDALCTNTK